MPDYSKSKIYKLVSNHTNDIYIGSTCQSLHQRKSGHFRAYKKYLSGKSHYMTSFKLFEKGDVDIVLIEEYSFNNKDELHRKEREYIEKLECVNKYIPGRTLKEYYQDNKDKIKQQTKQYRIDNKEKINQNNKQYRIDNKEKAKEYQKEYRENNKDKIKQNWKKFYQTNKEKVKEYQKEYIQHNKDKVKEYQKEYQKQYYETKKMSIKQYQKQYQEKKKLEKLNCVSDSV